MENYMSITADQTIETIKQTHDHWLKELKGKDFVYSKSS